MFSVNYVPRHAKTPKKAVRVKKRLYTCPPPSVEAVFRHCPDCNGLHHLRFRKLFLGGIEVSTPCCGRILDRIPFPPKMNHKERKAYLQWLND